MRAMKIQLSEAELTKSFDCFDRDRDGTISYDEFLTIIIGEMSDKRKAIVERTFKKIDKDKDNMLTIRDIEGIYNASNHPDVKMGKKTEWEVLEEFLSTFEQHTSDKDGNQSSKNKKILLKDFMGYYNKISMSIESDMLFEQTITNAWDHAFSQNSRGNQKIGWSNTQPQTQADDSAEPQ